MAEHSCVHIAAIVENEWKLIKQSLVENVGLFTYRANGRNMKLQTGFELLRQKRSWWQKSRGNLVSNGVVALLSQHAPGPLPLRNKPRLAEMRGPASSQLKAFSLLRTMDSMARCTHAHAGNQITQERWNKRTTKDCDYQGGITSLPLSLCTVVCICPVQLTRMRNPYITHTTFLLFGNRLCRTITRKDRHASLELLHLRWCGDGVRIHAETESDTAKQRTYKATIHRAQ